MWWLVAGAAVTALALLVSVAVNSILVVWFGRDTRKRGGSPDGMGGAFLIFIVAGVHVAVSALAVIALTLENWTPLSSDWKLGTALVGLFGNIGLPFLAYFVFIRR